MRIRPLAERFWEKVIVRGPSECWEWTASKNQYGYGTIGETATRKILKAHRVSYEINKGQIPEGKSVLHSCDNPGCVNPSHLSLGDQAKNMAEMATRLRSGRIKLSPKEVKAIREMRRRHPGKSGVTVWLANWFGISQPHVSGITTKVERRYA